MYNGDEIIKENEYRVVMPDFFLNGGDDFKEVRKWYTPKDVIKGRDIREQTKDYALKIKVINSVENPLINDKKPLFNINKRRNKQNFRLIKSKLATKPNNGLIRNLIKLNKKRQGTRY